MTLPAQVADLLSHDKLDEALEAAKAHVRSTPSDRDGRHIYIDLLILAGEYERADAQCNLASTLAPEETMGLALLRNQLRAMAARDAWFNNGAVPQFPQGPSPIDRAALQLGVVHRAGEPAREALAALDQKRGEQPMLWNGQRLDDLRDLDDRIPHALEVIMTGGAYLWVDFTKIASVQMQPIARPRDLAFRRAELLLVDGASAPVLLPAIYHGTNGDPSLRLGRRTDWVEEATGIITGRGQRCFLAGDDIVSFHDAAEIAALEASASEVRANG
jgi:type VI secretion system protein ImpE